MSPQTRTPARRTNLAGVHHEQTAQADERSETNAKPTRLRALG